MLRQLSLGLGIWKLVCFQHLPTGFLCRSSYDYIYTYFIINTRKLKNTHNSRIYRILIKDFTPKKEKKKIRIRNRCAMLFTCVWCFDTFKDESACMPGRQEFLFVRCSFLCTSSMQKLGLIVEVALFPCPSGWTCLFKKGLSWAPHTCKLQWAKSLLMLNIWIMGSDKSKTLNKLKQNQFLSFCDILTKGFLFLFLISIFSFQFE